MLVVVCPPECYPWRAPVAVADIGGWRLKLKGCWIARGCQRLGCGLGKTLAVRCGMVNWCVILCHICDRQTWHKHTSKHKSIGIHSHQLASGQQTWLDLRTTESYWIQFFILFLREKTTHSFIISEDSRKVGCGDVKLWQIYIIIYIYIVQTFFSDIPMSKYDTLPTRPFFFSWCCIVFYV